jgi:membrane protease YdiL (CAAX protease family)
LEGPAIAHGAAAEASSASISRRDGGVSEFAALLALGMVGWFLCSPVLPIPPDKHLRAFAIALAETLFLVGLGCLAARRPGVSPSTTRRYFLKSQPVSGAAGLFLTILVAAGVSIIATRIVQVAVVWILWSPALASSTPPEIRDAGRKAFEIFKAHPISVGVGFPIIEEIHFRLFLTTVLAWLMAKVTRSKAGTLGAAGWWTAIVIQSLAFGAVHAATGEGTLWWEPRVIQMLLEPRSVAGIVLGYVYWRRGLEASILTHIVADLSVLCYLALCVHPA